MKNVIGAKCTICGKMIEATPDITVCPHGRPVAMVLSHAHIDGQFKRS
jgi:DNA mismatch repair ATPase MutL